ncbi:MAG: ectonucleotide pyrophosphatase/phosphodiesterase [Flavisolibacter sp.]
MKKFIHRVLAFCFAVSLFSPAFAQPDTTQKKVAGRKNSAVQQDKPYLVLISVDGFRNDYPEKYNAVHLKQLSAAGVRADYMIPSFPSLTFPNHYTLVTGLYPAHHGLVSNYFFDRGRRQRYGMRDVAKVRDGYYYGGTPLWVLAEQQQMLSASFYWVGSEADIQNTRPTYYYRYNEAIPIGQRIETVVNWLQLPEEQRPHLITFYFPEVDHAGHDFGPDAPQTKAAVQFVDSAIFELTKAVAKTGLDVNYIVVSDHGMAPVKTKEPILVPQLDSSKFVLSFEGAIAQVYAFDKTDLPQLYDSLKKKADHFDVYLRDSVPAHLHYGSEDDRHNRIGDLVLISKYPYVFSAQRRHVSPATHGFDPQGVPAMRATFMAWGPAFKSGKKIPPFPNIEVYPIATRILQLPYNHIIDGTGKVATDVLK